MKHLALILVITATSCYGDMVSNRAGQDGVGGEGPDAAGLDPSLELTCADPQSTSDSGYHYPGMGCLGCHNGSVGPSFTVGGTLYADVGGSAPVSGVTVHLIGADGGETRMVTTLNGNFWTDQPVALPAAAFVSSCPDLTPMPILTETADCNGCHAAGSFISFAP